MKNMKNIAALTMFLASGSALAAPHAPVSALAANIARKAILGAYVKQGVPQDIELCKAQEQGAFHAKALVTFLQAQNVVANTLSTEESASLATQIEDEILLRYCEVL